MAKGWGDFFEELGSDGLSKAFADAEAASEDDVLPPGNYKCQTLAFDPVTAKTGRSECC